MRLTFRSSRTRFAGRINSGVREILDGEISVVLLRKKSLGLGQNAQEREMAFCYFQWCYWLGTADVLGHGVYSRLFRVSVSNRTNQLLLDLAASALDSYRLLLWLRPVAYFRKVVLEI